MAPATTRPIALWLFKLIRIYYACWKTRQPYDPQRYAAALQKNGSPFHKLLQNPKPGTIDESQRKGGQCQFQKKCQKILRAVNNFKKILVGLTQNSLREILVCFLLAHSAAPRALLMASSF